jgi:Galactose oxidase, central domain
MNRKTRLSLIVLLVSIVHISAACAGSQAAGPAPSRRSYHVMAYDAESDRVLTWGGVGPDESPLTPSVWSYDYNTNTWEEMSSRGPQPQGANYTAMAYDAESDRTTLYGGQGQSDQTWAYDYNTNTWTPLTPPGKVPGDLSKHAMDYSTAADRVILFGGRLSSGGGASSTNLTFGETWTYDPNTSTWTKVMSQP